MKCRGFRFEQLKDDDYEYIFCLGVQPDVAFAWLIPKSQIVLNGVWQERDGLTGQHRGQAAVDTYWLAVKPENVQLWLQPFGGTIEQLAAVAAHHFG